MDNFGAFFDNQDRLQFVTYFTDEKEVVKFVLSGIPLVSQIKTYEHIQNVDDIWLNRWFDNLWQVDYSTKQNAS